MSSLNKFQAIGNLGKDPEVKTLDSGAKVANFSIAMAEKFKNKSGELTEKTEWLSCVAWNKTADIVERYVKKGNKIYVEGKIETEKYTNSSGETRHSTKCKVVSIILLGGKGGSSESSAMQSNNDVPAYESPDDLPF